MKESPLKFTSSVEGLEVAEGTYKTGGGVIRIPKSRLKEMAKTETGKTLPKAESREVDLAPAKSSSHVKVLPQSPARQAEEISFVTPFGTMTAPYSPVIDQGNFIVLGMLPQSFTPVSYQENKDVVFTVKGTSFQECAAVYTGLTFTDPVYNSTYLVLMKVNKQ